MQRVLRSEQGVGKMPPLEEGRMLWGDVIIVMSVIYMEHQVRPQPEYTDVHLLAEVIASMFPNHLVAQHGYVYHLASRDKINRFEDADLMRKFGREVTVFFRDEKINQKLGYLKAIPHSWLFHAQSGTIINVIPVGGEPGVDYPTRLALHPDRPPYNVDPEFELLRGKLPPKEKVRDLRKKIEEWMKDPKYGQMERAIHIPSR